MPGLQVMMYSGIAFMIAAVLLASAEQISMIVIGRILQGIAISFASVSVPIYNSGLVSTLFTYLLDSTDTCHMSSNTCARRDGAASLERTLESALSACINRGNSGCTGDFCMIPKLKQPCPGDGQAYAQTLCWNIEYNGSFLQTINLIVNVTKATSWGWRLSLGFAFVPSFFLFLGADLHCGEPATLSATYCDLKGCGACAGGVFLPDSPNSLLERGFPEQVRTMVQD